MSVEILSTAAQLYKTIVSAAADRPARRGASRPPSLLYADFDSQCDKLVTDDRHYTVYHIDRSSKLTAPETIDAQLQNFLQSLSESSILHRF